MDKAFEGRETAGKYIYHIFPPQKFLVKLSKPPSATQGKFIFIALPFPLMNELQSRHFREPLWNNTHLITESLPIL